MKVVLGVTGCIAAYKAVEVLRGLQKLGGEVRVAMTAHATEFVSPLTFRAISGYPVITGMFSATDDPEIKHIELAQWADLLLVAPATANVLAKFAHGICDDFLSTLYVSTTGPVLVAPAMNVEMWAHPATQANVASLRERGVVFVDPEEGYLACRAVGAGRLAEPAAIVERAMKIGSALPGGAAAALSMSGEHVVITAGPTYESIDPVRGITNRSSGKMGYAVAAEAQARGARVALISGPVSCNAPPGVELLRVRSAAEMHAAVMERLDTATIVIMAAAVADYRPVVVAGQKIKKTGERLVLELEPTVDILAEVGKIRGDRIVVGFAAETEQLLANARRKLQSKGASLVVANDVSRADSGFDVDTNAISLVTAGGVEELPLMSKRDAAGRILDAVQRLRADRPAAS